MFQPIYFSEVGNHKILIPSKDKATKKLRGGLFGYGLISEFYFRGGNVTQMGGENLKMLECAFVAYTSLGGNRIVEIGVDG